MMTHTMGIQLRSMKTNKEIEDDLGLGVRGQTLEVSALHTTHQSSEKGYRLNNGVQTATTNP